MTIEEMDMTNQNNNENSNNAPVWKAKYGAVEIAVWEHANDKGSFYSITFQRSYAVKDEAGNVTEWKKTTQMRPHDLHGLALGMDDAYKFCKQKTE